jgi:UDPglucose--hexose-1-phosphate uridylyltransferase
MPEEEASTPGDSDGDATSAEARPARLVWSPFLGEYTGQSPARMRRRELSADCAFCADLTSGRVAAGSQTWIRPNDFPAFSPPTGECLILIYSGEHDRTFADLRVDEVMRVVALWQRVYAELAPRYACVMTWETNGEEIGQTQRHPHGQTYGIRELPDMMVRERAAVLRAEQEGRGCPFCAELREESAGPRVVHAGEHWLAFVPPYARYPYQARLAPRLHTPAVTGFPAEGNAARELSETLLRLIRAYNAAYRAPMPYMLALHQLDDPRFHFHIELLPVGRAPGKLKLAASSEMAWGFWMNDSFPEDKAAELRTLLAEERL